MSMLNIDDLNKNNNNKQKNKQLLYDKILQKCHYKIKQTSLNTEDLFCFYVMPEYIYGFPLYNYMDCLKYLILTLSKNGFDVKYTHPNLLYISWNGKKNPRNFSNKNKNEFRSIEEYKPSGSIMYNPQILNSLSNKLKVLN